MCISKEFKELIMFRTSKKRWAMNTCSLPFSTISLKKNSRKENQIKLRIFCQCLVVKWHASYARILEGGGIEGEWKLKNHFFFFFYIFKVKLLKICLPHSANYSIIPRTPLKNVCGSAHHWSFVVLVNFFDVWYSNPLSLL